MAGRITVVATLLALGLCACGQETTGSGPAPAATQSPAGSIAEDLNFTGRLSGHMTSGSRGDMYACATTGGALAIGPILGDVGGRQVALNIVNTSFNGPGSYAAGGVTFDSGTDHYYPATGTSGTLAVAADLRSGSLDIDVAANTDPNAVVGHVKGTWRCPPDAA